LTREHALVSFNIQSVLCLFKGVNSIDTTIKYLIPDMFTDENASCLGTRTTMNLDEPAYFVVMRDLFNEDKYPTVSKSSKVWTSVDVLDFDSLFSKQPEYGYGYPSTMSPDARYSLLLQITMRYILGLGDFAYRNFIRIGDRVWNLDTEQVGGGRNIRFAKNEKDLMIDIMKKKKSKYLACLKDWFDNNLAWELLDITLGNNSFSTNSAKQVLSNIMSQPESIFE